MIENKAIFAPPLNETVGEQIPEIIGILLEIMNFCRRFLSLKTASVKKQWQNSDDLRPQAPDSDT